VRKAVTFRVSPLLQRNLTLVRLRTADTFRLTRPPFEYLSQIARYPGLTFLRSLVTISIE
jgi:hypothetical protein